jgi:hypothetical protein
VAKQYVLLHDRLSGSTLSRADGYQCYGKQKTVSFASMRLNLFRGRKAQCPGTPLFRSPALETPVLLGRDFTGEDDANAPKVAIINKRMAHDIFGDTSRIGRRLSIPTFAGDNSWYSIVGVVADSKSEDLREAVRPMIYMSTEQTVMPAGVTFEVRTAGGEHRLVLPRLIFWVDLQFFRFRGVFTIVCSLLLQGGKRCCCALRPGEPKGTPPFPDSRMQLWCSV